MHIGMLTACYAPVINGVTQLVALYEKHLSAAGHQVTIFTLGDPLPGEDSRCVIRSPGVSLGKTGYRVAFGYSSAAQRELRHVDILHSHHPLMGLEFARRYGRGPVVFTNHTRYDLYLNSYGHVPRWLTDQMVGFGWRKLTKLADAIIAPSASIAKLLRESGVDAPIEVIENGVEVSRFQHVSQRFLRADLRIPEEAFIFTFVGRMAPEKSVQRLLVEFQLAAKQSERVYLLGVGGGPLLERVQAIAEEYGLAERTRFVGSVEHEQVAGYLAISDAFVSASVTEVHPLAVIEALAAGLPVVAMDAPGMNDIVVNNVSGLLVDGSMVTLARAMAALAGDDSLRGRLAMGARTAGLRFDIRNTVERTLSLYGRLLKQHDARTKPSKSTGRIRSASDRQRREGHEVVCDGTNNPAGDNNRE